MRPTTSWISIALLAAALSFGQALIDVPTASAQIRDCDAPGAVCVRRVGPDGKGILGGGVLGAELMLMVNALIVNAGARELDQWWAWTLFPAVGAAGGAVLGYFLLEEPLRPATDLAPAPDGSQRRGYPDVAVAVFATSLALIVPTFVGVLALIAYNPGREAVTDDDASGETNENDQASAARRVFAGGPGLLRFDNGTLLLGVPLVSSLPRYTAEEQRSLQLQPASDLHVPVVSGAF